MKDLLSPIRLLRLIRGFFWPPSQFQLSIPCFIAKIAFLTPEPTYDYILLNKTESKWTIILREFHHKRIHDKRQWNRYKRILKIGQIKHLIDAYFTKTERGNRIACLFIRPPNTTKTPKYTLVYSHGNACDLGILTGCLWKLSKNTKCNVFSYDYSGYGLSSGKPSELNAYYDIESAVNSLISRYNIRPQNMILYGESMGSVPTVELSSTVNFAGVVLHAAFMSGLRVVYLYKRKTWLFDPFPNIERVHRIQCPVLVIHGTKDAIIHISHGIAIYNRCKYVVEPLWVKGGHHNDIRLFKDYYPRLKKFIYIDLLFNYIFTAKL